MLYAWPLIYTSGLENFGSIIIAIAVLIFSASHLLSRSFRKNLHRSAYSCSVSNSLFSFGSPLLVKSCGFCSFTGSVMVETPNQTRVLKLFKYCQTSFGKGGVRVTFPRNTDPMKTYKWRYMEKFLEKVDQWGVSDTTAYQIVDAMVQHAKRNGHLKAKGMAILESDAILEIGYRSIEKIHQRVDGVLARIKHDKRLIDDLADPGELLRRDFPGASPNIVRWFIQGKISLIYICISKKCLMAIKKLSSDDRALIIQKTQQIVDVRELCTRDVMTKVRIKQIMGTDWALSC